MPKNWERKSDIHIMVRAEKLHTRIDKRNFGMTKRKKILKKKLVKWRRTK